MNEYYIVYTNFNGLEVIFMVCGELQNVKEFVEKNTMVSRIVNVAPELAKSLVETLNMKVYYAPNWDIQTTVITQTVPEGD